MMKNGASDEGSGRSNSQTSGNNIILVGIMGCGKSTIGQRLAYYIGYGFVDLDKRIEEQEGKPVSQIFADSGEDHFRGLEYDALAWLKNVRNHVVSVGGGAVLDDENWQTLKRLGKVVWVKTPPLEIARRFVMKPDEIRGRPLLSDLVEVEDRDERLKLLTDRLSVLIKQRENRYGEADVVMGLSYSTAETSAQMLKGLLEEHEIL